MPDGRRSVKARMWHGPLRYTLQDLTVLRSPRKLAPPSGKHTEVCSFILLSTRLIKKVKKQIFSSYLPLPTSMTNNSSNQPRTVLFSLFSRGENSLQNMKLSHVSKVTQLEKSWLWLWVLVSLDLHSRLSHIPKRRAPPALRKVYNSVLRSKAAWIKFHMRLRTKIRMS